MPISQPLPWRHSEIVPMPLVALIGCSTWELVEARP